MRTIFFSCACNCEAQAQILQLNQTPNTPNTLTLSPTLIHETNCSTSFSHHPNLTSKLMPSTCGWTSPIYYFLCFIHSNSFPKPYKYSNLFLLINIVIVKVFCFCLGSQFFLHSFSYPKTGNILISHFDCLVF